MPVGEDWKLMGLAAFGDASACYDEMKKLSTCFSSGEWKINRYSVEAKLIDRPFLIRQTALWKKLSALVDKYGDIDTAAAAQAVLEDNIVDYFRNLEKKYTPDNIVLAGGVFHNIKACMRLKAEFPEINFYIHPAAGDSGTSIGAALELYSSLTGKKTNTEMPSAALGAEYSENEIYAELVRQRELLEWTKPVDVNLAAAELLAEGKVLGLFRGRAEWGPRALGQRSVIADPGNAGIRNRINSVLKDREWFMPFAPSVLEEDGPEYFKDYFYSPFMTHAFHVTEVAKKDLAAAVHLDGTARPQIVRKSVLPRYHALISAFREKTGRGGVLNTSFNRHGLPMVNSPGDAVNHLLWGCIDKLVIGRWIVSAKKIIPFRKRLDLKADKLIKKWSDFDERMLEIREKRRLISEKFIGRLEKK
jgi:carbamoyltransferase